MTDKLPPELRFLTVPQVAKALHVCPLTVRRMIHAGRLEAEWFGARNRCIRVSEAALHKMLEGKR